MNISKRISKFQEGGPMPAPAPGGGAPAPAPAGGPAEGGAPAEGGGGDPIEQIAQVAMQALETQDCEAAMAVCEAFVGLLQGGGAEGGAPAGPEAGGAPVYRRGGRLVRREK